MINKLFKLFMGWQLGATASYILSVASMLLGIVLISWLFYLVFKIYFKYFSKIIYKHIRPLWHDLIVKYEVLNKILSLIPAISIYVLLPLIQMKNAPITFTITDVLQRIISVYVIIIICQIISGVFSVIEDGYSNIAKTAKQRPITSYVQIVKIVIWSIAIICVMSVIIDKSPATLFAGLGALTAVIMLVFKDSILGLVASIQLSAHEMISIGDSVDIPSYNASGEVIHISLTTVKIRNYDNSITMLPTYVLISCSIINWYGVNQVGTRRVKRSLTISPTTIKFCDEALIEKLSNIALISGMIAKSRGTSLISETTNLGLFRNYVKEFLNQHADVKKDNSCLVKELQPTPHGVPVELYFYTHITDMELYENLQAEIFDHLFAILPTFELKVNVEEPSLNRNY